MRRGAAHGRGGDPAAAHRSAWGHRTLFFRDPDGNIVEIYADI